MHRKFGWIELFFWIFHSAHVVVILFKHKTDGGEMKGTPITANVAATNVRYLIWLFPMT